MEGGEKHVFICKDSLRTTGIHMGMEMSTHIFRSTHRNSHTVRNTITKIHTSFLKNTHTRTHRQLLRSTHLNMYKVSFRNAQTSKQSSLVDRMRRVEEQF